jgi:hypothetical protein
MIKTPCLVEPHDRRGFDGIESHHLDTSFNGAGPFNPKCIRRRAMIRNQRPTANGPLTTDD